MDLLHWINRRLQPDQARHVAVAALLAVVFAHLPAGELHLVVSEPWMRALWAGVALSLMELVQRATGTGVADWNDVAANAGGAGLIALGTLA
jgi:hypothetical protein